MALANAREAAMNDMLCRLYSPLIQYNSSNVNYGLPTAIIQQQITAAGHD